MVLKRTKEEVLVSSAVIQIEEELIAYLITVNNHENKVFLTIDGKHIKELPLSYLEIEFEKGNIEQLNMLKSITEFTKHYKT